MKSRGTGVEPGVEPVTVERTQAELGRVILRMFRSGADTLDIARRLRIMKQNGRPNEARVCDMLHAARAAERMAALRQRRA